MNEGIKVLMVADFSPRIDEGMKKTAFHLAKFMPSEISVFQMDESQGKLISRIFAMRKSRPDIVHYLHGPTLWSLIFIKTSAKLMRAKALISATHPELPKKSRFLSRIFRVDRIITLSERMAGELRKYAKEIIVIPSGVDIETFNTVSEDKRAGLRLKFGYKNDEFIVFHAGPLTGTRNLDWLIEVRKYVDRVIIAGSNSTPQDRNLSDRLKKEGITIFPDYLPDIQELYQIADCYAFPVILPGASIDFPLSVIEALACGTPVVTTKYGALAEHVFNTNGVFYANDLNAFIAQIGQLRLKKGVVSRQQIRESVENLSWKSVATQVAGVYHELVRTDE